jgi:hypothetical protein
MAVCTDNGLLDNGFLLYSNILTKYTVGLGDCAALGHAGWIRDLLVMGEGRCCVAGFLDGFELSKAEGDGEERGQKNPRV